MNLLQSQKEQLRNLVSGIKLYAECNVDEHEYTSVEVFSEGSTKLLKYSDTGTPLLIVPSLINKASILDLSPDNSFILNLKALGFMPYLLVWDDPLNEEFSFTLADYQARLIRIIKKLDKKIALLGYCMGGIMGLMAYPHVSNLVSKIITIATPWDFSSKLFTSFGNSQYPYFDNIGYIPKEFIRDIFYLTDAASANNKYIKLGKGEMNLEEFTKIENWVNCGINMTHGLFKDLQAMLRDNSLMSFDLSNFKIPCLNIIAQKDSVCPLESTIALSSRLPNAMTKFYDSGHIGMIVKAKYNMPSDIASWCL